MDGFLLLDKPKDWTSFDVVAKVRGILRASGISKPKVGHTGTLDPLATGLVIIVVGSYCKRAEQFSKMDKTYAVRAHLGVTSTTGDEEGEKTQVSAQKPSQQAVEAAVAKFTGEVSQIPPVFSAIKVGGKRAYQLARQGKEVKIEPRTISINGYKDVSYQYPELKFTVDVSSGTYIRTLVEDIGKELATGAYTTDLRRLTVGEYSVADAVPVDNLSPEIIAQNLRIND